MQPRPIAAKLTRSLKRNAAFGEIRRLKDGIATLGLADNLQKAMSSRIDLIKYHPGHAIYLFAQNKVSEISEKITALRAMEPFVDLISNAEDTYLPSGPPMSPLTLSYFSSWAFFDACVGPEDETIGSIIIEAIGPALGMHDELMQVVKHMQESRMSVYAHEGVEGETIALLRDLVTGTQLRAHVPAAYHGREGELWYVRVFPPPRPEMTNHVVFTTPYVLLKPSRRSWEDYFHRAVPENPTETHLARYARHMKFGPTRDHWSEFVFEAYVNHNSDSIFLRGLPDDPASRPHSRENWE